MSQREDEDTLTLAIVTLASQGLKVPQRQKPRGRLWLNDGSCVRLRPEHANHVWNYDFAIAKTHDGRTVRMLNLTTNTRGRACWFVLSGAGAAPK
jgi:hypothetical protein